MVVVVLATRWRQVSCWYFLARRWRQVSCWYFLATRWRQVSCWYFLASRWRQVSCWYMLASRWRQVSCWIRWFFGKCCAKQHWLLLPCIIHLLGPLVLYRHLYLVVKVGHHHACVQPCMGPKNNILNDNVTSEDTVTFVVLVTYQRFGAEENSVWLFPSFDGNRC